MTIFLIIVAWISVGLLNAGAWNANMRVEFPRLMADPREARKNLSISLLLGLVCAPFGFIVVLFLTGFYQDGWTLSGKPTDAEPYRTRS